MKLMIPNARLAFANIFQPKAVQAGDEPAFSCSLLLDPKTDAATIQTINAAIEHVAKEKWGAKAEAIMKAIRAKGDLCLRNGDEKAEYDGFEGKMYVSARSKTRPTVLDRDKTPLTQADGRPYSGCYVNASVDIYAQDNAYGKRINASLRGLQFFKDGDAFGGGTPASADEFDDLGMDETDDLPL